MFEIRKFSDDELYIFVFLTKKKREILTSRASRLPELYAHIKFIKEFVKSNEVTCTKIHADLFEFCIYKDGIMIAQSHEYTRLSNAKKAAALIQDCANAGITVSKEFD
jgi:hypothetical protein